MFTTVSRNGTWHCFKVCTFRFKLDFVASRIFYHEPRIWWSKKTKSAKNETLFAINRLLQNQLIIPDPSVEFEFSKWWNAHVPYLNLTNAIVSRFNPLLTVSISPIRSSQTWKYVCRQFKCIKVQIISKNGSLLKFMWPTAAITTAARSLSIPTMIQHGHGQFVVLVRWFRTRTTDEGLLVLIPVQGWIKFKY